MRASMKNLGAFFLSIFVLQIFNLSAVAARQTLSLDGEWQIADSVSGEEIPGNFPAKVPVPGLAHLAKPAFKDIDRFMTGANRKGRLPSQVTRVQERNYLWYRTSFRAPKTPVDIALLEIKKAQFGAAVWLNGQKVGEYPGCFSAGRFHLADAIRWGADNTLVVRIGAHPATLPDGFPTGTDFEKRFWTPGIYDSVSIAFCNNPLIETIQIAPCVATNEITVQTRIRNLSGKPLTTTLTQNIRPWKTPTATPVSAVPQAITIPANTDHLHTQKIAIPDAQLWSPDNPFLYTLETATGGDTLRTRFGMREFRFDRERGIALLNNQPIRIRGSNITLHRFFEDPLSGNLPWDDAWVRKLLGEWPRKLHWNFFRFCIGPVPDRWLDICDEEGFLIQNEFFIWTSRRAKKKQPPYPYDIPEVIRQYSDWMRDNWNHPSLVIWDANNETEDPVFNEKIIPAVRPLDLSKRPWENSYNPPNAPDDPVEVHPYLMNSKVRKFSMTSLETMDGRPRISDESKKGHPVLLNEYGWLWLNRDGTPTELTKHVYPQLLPPDGGTVRQRLDLHAYLLAAKTEFWRVRRHHAGIVHFVFLTCSIPGGFTSDSWTDLAELELDPAFFDYVSEAFKPLGAYINFFQPTLAPNSTRNFPVTLVDDRNILLSGTLRLTLTNLNNNTAVAATSCRFSLEPDGAATFALSLKIPAEAKGEHILTATAAADNIPETPTRSRRHLAIE